MLDLSALADLPNWFELPNILLASWIALPFNFLLVRKSEEVGLFLVLVIQILLTSMFTLGYLTHGNMWISACIPAGIFFVWLAYQCWKELRQINRGE